MIQFGKALRAGLVLSALVAFPAVAQKSKDTLRMPFTVPVNGIDFYNDPGPVEETWSPVFYDTLIDFDADAGKFIPRLAKSWTHTNPTTIEMELRGDVKWHDGQAFSAEDVAYIINWLIDPKVPLRLKANWEFIKGAEVLGPNKVRVTLDKPTPYDLMRLAYGTYIYPKHVHAPLENKAVFGSAPVGTGPLKATMIEKNKGIVAERSPVYGHAGPTKPIPKIGKFESQPMPDVGTQIAQLKADNVDVLAVSDFEQATDLAKDSRFNLTVGQALLFSFVAIPEQGRNNVPALRDVRVRKAIGMAIDRTALTKIVMGDIKLKHPLESVCQRIQAGCDYTKTAPAYDPAGAKKLLRDAGFGDGFEVTITTFQGPVRAAAEAVAGMLRSVGIRASVNAVPIPVARNLQRDGKLQIQYYGWGGGAIFDASAPMVRFFAIDELGDPELAKLATESLGVMDPAKRRAATAKVIDMSIDEGILYPMISHPPIYVTRKDVELTTPVPRAGGPLPIDFIWK